MADYHVPGTQTVANPTDSTLSCEAPGSAARFAVYDFSTGFTLGTPTDSLLDVTCQRTTVDGVGGNTPVAAPLNPDDGVASTKCEANHSTEPTYTAAFQMWGPLGLHMRATYRWVAAPGKEIQCANAAGAGVGWFAVSTAVAPLHTMSVYFTE